jgi:hypothetical protein
MIVRKQKSKLELEKNCAYKKISYHYSQIFKNAKQIEKINSEYKKLKKGGLFERN